MFHTILPYLDFFLHSLQLTSASKSLPSILDDDFWGDNISLIERQLAVVLSIILPVTSLLHLKKSCKCFNFLQEL